MSGLRVRTPKKAKDNYDEAIEEYEREQNPKAIKNRVRKAQKAAEQALVTGDKMARCGAALKLLGLRDDAYWFQEPVPVGEVPDYLDIVEEPMDFRTIAGRLAGGEYGDDALAFASDVRKVFTNAVKYNWSPDHPCNIAARAGLREFEQLFARANGNGSAPKPPPPSAQPHKKRHRDGGGGAVAGSSSGASAAAVVGGGGGASAAGGGGGGGGGVKRARMRGSASEAGSADRDRELIAGLGEYLVSCGGAEGLVDGWYTRTEVRKGGGTAGTFDTYFFTPAGKRFRSRAEIARFFQLEAAPAKSAKSQDAEERKALKSAEREAKKQQKEEAAAARQAQLDAERALRERYPVPDERLAEEEPHEPPLGPRPTPLPAGTGAVPASAVGDLLQVCDFLRALGPQLQLPSYSPSELAAALVESEGEPNPKLADLTQALLQLVLTDKSLGEWWGVREAPNGPKAAFARASSDSKKVKWWEADAKPLLKVDLEAILASSEPTSRTRRWVAQLETVAPMRTNTGVPIRQALVAARAISSDGEVRRYLDRAISHWKGNAAGTTKFAALWLAAQVRRSRPQIFTAEGMAAVEAEEDGGVDTSLDTSEDVPPPEEEEDGASELAPSEAAPSELPDELEEEDKGEEGEAGGEEGDEGDEGGEEIQATDEIDGRLWTGAAAEGWVVRAKGKTGQKWGNWIYVGPSGTKYHSKVAAFEARDAEAHRAADTDSVALSRLKSEAGPPEALVGARVSVLWSEEGGAGAWYPGQLWAFDAATREYHILYDDNSEERLDLTKVKHRLVYQLQPPHLLRSRNPPAPEVSDVTAYSWPPLLAAVALRLLRHWDPACAIDDAPPDPHAPPGQPHGDSAGGAAPSASSPAELAPRLQPAQPSAGGASARKSDPMEVQAAAPASTSPACGGGAAAASPGGGGGLAVSVQAAGRTSAEGGGCPDPAPSPRARVKRQGSLDGLLPTSPPSKPLSSGGDASALALPSACGGASQLEPAIRALLGQSPSLAHEVYSRLPPLQKLGLLRVLVDGACDSPHTAKAVDEAMARRRGVLEREEEAEKEKRRETRTLRDEARHALREQLAEQREAAGEEGEQLLPAEVSEVAVSLEVQKRQEALACGGQVEVLSREALQQAESDLAVELELQAANGIDSDGRDFSAADLEGIVARRDLIKHRRDTFGPARDAAQEGLRAAASSGDAAVMEAALEAARAAALEGDCDEDGIGPGGRWVAAETRDVYTALHEMHKYRDERVAEGRRQLELSQTIVRTAPLGRDRYGRRHWLVQPLEEPRDQPHVWCEPRSSELVGGIVEPPREASRAADGGESRPCGKRDWQHFVGESACAALAASLDERGERESHLRASLERTLRSRQLQRLAASG